MKPKIKPEIVICDCCSTDHQIVILKDKDETLGNIAYLHIHLTTHRNFFKRLLIGLKYAFGYKCIYGNFDEFIVTKDNIEQFDELVKFVKNENL
ncbi:hypothetical protein M0Q50_03630 [bacterium]|jgi:hypothetical protein|nr:hypothetical protein [bacterium]